MYIRVKCLKFWTNHVLLNDRCNFVQILIHMQTTQNRAQIWENCVCKRTCYPAVTGSLMKIEVSRFVWSTFSETKSSWISNFGLRTINFQSMMLPYLRSRPIKIFWCIFYPQCISFWKVQYTAVYIFYRCLQLNIYHETDNIIK